MTAFRFDNLLSWRGLGECALLILAVLVGCRRPLGQERFLKIEGMPSVSLDLDRPTFWSTYEDARWAEERALEHGPDFYVRWELERTTLKEKDRYPAAWVVRDKGGGRLIVTKDCVDDMIYRWTCDERFIPEPVKAENMVIRLSGSEIESFEKAIRRLRPLWCTDTVRFLVLYFNGGRSYGGTDFVRLRIGGREHDFAVFEPAYSEGPLGSCEKGILVWEASERDRHKASRGSRRIHEKGTWTREYDELSHREADVVGTVVTFTYAKLFEYLGIGPLPDEPKPWRPRAGRPRQSR